MFRKLFIFFMLLFISIKGTAQSDFKYGYIIKSNSDTIWGLIDSRSDSFNAGLCVFKPSENADEVRFKPCDLLGYRFEGGKYFISREVRIDDSKQIIFLEYLVKGILDLYYYRDAKGDHYLIETDKGELMKLEESVNERNDPQLGVVSGTIKYYVGSLKYAMSDAPQLSERINEVTLDRKKLKNLVHDYHNYVCNSEECVIYEKELPGFSLGIEPFVAYQIEYAKIRYSIEYPNYDFGPGYYPMFGISLISTLHSIDERVNARINLSYGEPYLYSYSPPDDFHPGEYHEVHFHRAVAQGDLLVEFNFPSGKIRPSFFGGITMQKTMNSEFRVDRIVSHSSYSEHFTGWDKFWIGATAGSGINIDLKPIGVLDFNVFYRIIIPQSNIVFHTIGTSLGIIF